MTKPIKKYRYIKSGSSIIERLSIKRVKELKAKGYNVFELISIETKTGTKEKSKQV